MSVTLFKLSLRNSKRQAKDYLVYFITIVMSSALIYAFNGLVFSKELGNLSKMMDALPLVAVLASAVVVCIIGWLISYTIKFMLERRSRELGTYILIGLENRKVAQLFFLENLIVGGVAFVFGVLLGNFIFQALRAIVLSLFEVSYHFVFSFSFQTLGLSLFYFVLMYFFALFKSYRMIKRIKIYDLIYFDKKNEGVVFHKERTRRIVFVGSIILGILGTILILLGNFELGLIGSALIIMFLYGFFISFSSGVPAYFNRRPQQKFKGNTMLVFRALTLKLGTMGVVMATISMLFTATVIAEGSGMVFNVIFKNREEQTTSFDLYISYVSQRKNTMKEFKNYIDDNIMVRDDWEYSVYFADDAKMLSYVEENTSYYRVYDVDMVMKASDYKVLRKMLGYKAPELKSGQYVIHCMNYLGKVLKDYRQPLEVGGQTLEFGTIYTENFTQSGWNGNGRGYILVVPDEVVENLTLSHNAYVAMTFAPLAEVHYYELKNIRKQWNNNYKYYETIHSKAAEEAESASMFAVINFPLYYIALVLTMVAATILTIHQLSESNRYNRQFKLLRNLGMEEREMRSTLKKQFAIFFAMPAVPPILIGVPFIYTMGASLDPGVISGIGQNITTVAMAIGLFFAIYFIYFFASYNSLKRSVFMN